MNEAHKGNLVYVPSDAMLYNADEAGVVKEVLKLSKPINLLVVGSQEKTYEVIHDGQKWLVDKSKTYEVTL